MKQILILTLLLAGINAGAMAQGDFAGGGNESDSPRTFQEELSAAIPESVMLRYEVGEAPFYVRARSYARNLERAFSRPSETQQKLEMETLGISLAELEEINDHLRDFNRQQRDRWSEAIRTKCIEIGGNGIANDDAKNLIASLDNRDVEVERLANNALDNIAAVLGEDIRAKLVARIVEAGEKILFTRVDTVKRIETMEGDDFAAYITNRCGML